MCGVNAQHLMTYVYAITDRRTPSQLDYRCSVHCEHADTCGGCLVGIVQSCCSTSLVGMHVAVWSMYGNIN